MSFVDIVEITLKAGKGGDGHRSFRRERFIAKGGPDGGDGGKGGDIILRANKNQNTLSNFRYQKKLIAEDGQPGSNSRKTGKSGQDYIVDVPIGTQIIKNKKIVADLLSSNEELIAAKGGKGGFGNAHFTSSTRQAPNFAEKGERGEEIELTLELKLIADVGLVGLPNAGKSTLLSRLSNARPEIADYPFTTLAPNLGVVDVDKQTSILLADIPGLIEGAAKGKGLGHEFLRHIERTKLIVHVIDIYEEDISTSYLTIRNELKAYSSKLAKLKEVVALNKVDGFNQDLLSEKQAELKRVIESKSVLITISAKDGTNLNELKFILKDKLAKINLKKKTKKKDDVVPVITLEPSPEDFKVVKVKGGFRIKGQKIERFASRTDFNNDQAVDRLKDILKKQGILSELNRRKLKAGDHIYFGEDDNNYLIY